MYLNDPDQSAPAEYMLDWLELRVLRSRDHTAPLDDLWLSWNEQFGSLPDGEDDIQRDTMRSALDTELARRQKALGCAYPFDVQESMLCLASEITCGGWCYLLCLRLSLAETQLVEAGSFSDISNDEQKLFQLCSTYAAAGLISGESIWFGWPRPEKTKFLEALRDVYHERFCEGKVLEDFLPGQSRATKDDQVDIIAFVPANDTLPSQICLLGQVASGKNWKTKPLSSDQIHKFHGVWFAEPPGSPPLRALFVPFCLFAKEHHQEGMGALKRCMLQESITYGILLTRYRIPYYVERAVTAHQKNPKGPIQPGEMEQRVELMEWGKNFLKQVHGSD